MCPWAVAPPRIRFETTLVEVESKSLTGQRLAIARFDQLKRLASKFKKPGGRSRLQLTQVTGEYKATTRHR